jgi:arylformamidase
MMRNQLEIDAAYNLRLLVSDSERHVRGWGERSAQAREHQPHRLSVPYGPTLDEVLDIFPSCQPDAPIHVFFHGGYWCMLSARDFSFLAPVGREAGWCTVVVNYALCPKVTIGEIVRQARASIAWIHRNAASFGGDPARIVVSGHSAGGHLVGRLLATDWSSVYGLPAATIKAGLPISGLFDLDPMRWSWLQAKLQLSEDDVARESPMRHLPPSAIPQVAAVGAAESAEFRRQSNEYAGALAIPYLEIGGRHHFDVLDDLAAESGVLWRELVRLERGAE